MPVSFDSTKFINPRQVGGIDSYLIADGESSGNRVCEVNTGGGLCYRVMVDRGLDIDRAFMQGSSLSYLTHRGVTPPSRALDHGSNWLRGFPGGLLVSCGPFNTGAPGEDAGETLGLHGQHSNTAAELESVIQPDPPAGRMEMAITGIIRYGAFYGPNLTLRRTLRSVLGEPAIHVEDAFVNVGNTAVTHAWLLHINFGYPLLDEGTTFMADVIDQEPRDDPMSLAYFRSPTFDRFPAPSVIHAGNGHVFRYLTVKPDENDRARATIWNDARQSGVAIEYSVIDFPRLGQWLHWGSGEYVAALEPMTGGVSGRADDRRRGWIRTLAPGEQRTYRYSLTALTSQPDRYNAK